jgi:formylglycine-generating enzyme required for sulfatase activity
VVAPLLVLGLLSAEAPRGAIKVALLVGVNRYDHRGFDDLRFAERDIEDLAAELTSAGFRVVKLKGSAEGELRATRENIDTQLHRLLKGVTKDDVVLVALNGHGQQLEVKGEGKKEDAFFCPVDAVKDDPQTLFSLSYLIDDVLTRKGGKNLVLVDACRDRPKDPGRGSRGVQGRVVALPEDTAVLFSCAAGQQSFETEKAGGGHGIFTHCVLEGLREKVKQDGQVTWSALVASVEDRMDSREVRGWLPEGREQTPVAAGNVRRVVLAIKDGGDRPKPGDGEVKREPERAVAPFGEARAKELQAAWAKHLGREVVEAVKLDDDGTTMEFVLIPPGKFKMGSPESEEGRWHGEDQHEVEITKPFYLGKYTVTIGQFRRFVDNADYKTEAEKDAEGWGYNAEAHNFEGGKGIYSWKTTGWEQTEEYPVVNVAWTDAQSFCEWLGKKQGKKFRLPTEAEWEYGCRAGTTTRFYGGNEDDCLKKSANVADVSLKTKLDAETRLESQFQDWDDSCPFTAAVGKFRPNAFGLYDMHGNVWQWCQDWLGQNYYKDSPRQDPQGPGTGSRRVNRGGAFSSVPRDCRAASRFQEGPTYQYCFVGFRVVWER